MERSTLRETIKSVVEHHLKNENGLAMGQCLTAVGWVGGTLPELYEDDGMIELSMADVAGGGIAVGAALAGRRPMYIIRYQGFNWYNAPSIVNYAAKSKEIWNIPCPMFVRSIAMEGGIGPVAGSSHHSLYYRMPGIRILSPMSPSEYLLAYEKFMKSDDVFYISEHRGSFDNKNDLDNIYFKEPHITLFPISITRFNAIEASKKLHKIGINVNICHIFEVKPFNPSKREIDSLIESGIGIILDDDYVDGIAKNIAFDLISISGVSNIHVMGLENKTAGFSPEVDNLPPTTEMIINKIKSLI